MSEAQKLAVLNHRRRLKRCGLVRLEVQASRPDAPLIRGLARALRGHAKEASVLRARLRAAMARPGGPSLKALLAAAPLEGIDLTRARDRGRDVRL
ncbi:MAG: hypothetical protein ACT4P2_01990 [Pseudomonadota bacterium]